MDQSGSGQLPEHPVEELEPQTYCQRAVLELAALIRHQRKPKHRTRHDSALLRRCVEQVVGMGAPARGDGPWHAGTRPLKRPGRGGLPYIPFVSRGKTVVMVGTPQEAQMLAAFLNFCGTQEFGN